MDGMIENSDIGDDKHLHELASEVERGGLRVEITPVSGNWTSYTTKNCINVTQCVTLRTSVLLSKSLELQSMIHVQPPEGHHESR